MRRPDAPVFVVGVARSGTTLLSAMLSAHPRLDCGPESRFFARYRHLDDRARARILDPATWPRPAVDFVASLRNQGHPVTELFGLTTAEIGTYLAGCAPSTEALLESLTVLHAQRAGKARWVEKTPRHLLMTDILRDGWPEARIVRIVRDPRDVALSLARMPFAKDSVVGNLVRIDADDRASRDRIENDPRAMTLRYEDLVTEPERELRRLCDFIGEEYAPSMLDSRGSAAAWPPSTSGGRRRCRGRSRPRASGAGARRCPPMPVASPVSTSLTTCATTATRAPRTPAARSRWYRSVPAWGRTTSSCCWSWRVAAWSCSGRRRPA